MSISQLFNFSTRLGLVFISECAGLSTLAVVSLLFYFALTTLLKRVRGHARRQRWSSVSHVHWYLLSLLVSDFIQAIGGLMDIRWIAESGVTVGPYCTAQGLFKQMGDVGVSLASLAIGLHTFTTLVLRHNLKARPFVPAVVLGLIWLFIALVIGISLGTHSHQDYYDDTQYWCWISARFPVQRIALEYFWLWLACFGNSVLYCIMMVTVLRRNSLAPLAISNGSVSRSATGRTAVALKMLYYPAIYIVTVLPITVARFMAFFGHSVPFSATAFADAVFALSGLFNVVLFCITRPALFPRPTVKVTVASGVSFTRQTISYTIPPTASHGSQEVEDYGYEGDLTLGYIPHKSAPLIADEDSDRRESSSSV